MNGYYLATRPCLLPRIGHGRPMTLAETLDRATGHRYAVIYRLTEDGRPIPVVAGAGSHELVHVPSGRRFQRHQIDWHRHLTEWELAIRADPRIATHPFPDDPWWTPWRRARYLASVPPSRTPNHPAASERR